MVPWCLVTLHRRRDLAYGRDDFHHVQQEIVLALLQLAVHWGLRAALQAGRTKGHTAAAWPSIPRIAANCRTPILGEMLGARILNSSPATSLVLGPQHPQRRSQGPWGNS